MRKACKRLSQLCSGLHAVFFQNPTYLRTGLGLGLRAGLENSVYY